MRYKLLGRSGLRVSELSLGTITFGEDWGYGATKEESRRIFDVFVEAGGNFIDTSCNYTDGTSEKFLGEFIQGNRERFVISTKYSLTSRPNDPNGGGNHRKNLFQTVEKSLRRLKTDYIDLLWLHAWDFMTPVDEVMRALDDMVRTGKVLYVGISDTPAWIVSQANTLAMLRGWSPFIGLQVEYSLIQRTPERDLLPMAHEFDIGVVAWAPIGGGVLTGKYLNGQTQIESKRLTPQSQRLNEKNRRIVEEVQKIAQEMGKAPVQIAINWVRQQAKGVIIPIVGARNESQMTENLGSLDFKLTTDQLNQLERISSIDLGFPHDFLTSDQVRNKLFGNTYTNIDNHRNKI
jgi:aryl-alcohol dehydrogenase-like predicted oxidoreductase